ncbi:integrase, catalytic region, zinc finger, CCHC-type containing protein [Tanacetum coccineum]
MALLAQSFKAILPQMNNQLRASSNTRNQATIQDGRVVVQNVQGGQLQNQRARETGQNGALVLDEEVGTTSSGWVNQGNTFDADVAFKSVQDLALNEDNISSRRMYCDAFDSEVYSPVNDGIVPHDPIAIELKIYKEQVAIYEQRAKFELTERQHQMDDQMRMLIQNHNKTEENLKKELHSFKLQLKSTMENNKILEETDLDVVRLIRNIFLIANENLVAECLSKDVFYTATDSILNVSRFSDMHDAFTSAQKLCEANSAIKVLPTKQWKPTGRFLPLARQCPLVRSNALKSDCLPADPLETIAPVVYNLACTNHRTPIAIRDPMVYYVEELGHNLFSVGQFCNSDLEVAFKKHTCFVRDLDGVDLIKGSRGTNLYTIFVEDMKRSSPIFLLSKASKNKSWLWHRRLNHLNFGTLNDLARKDLVRGLPRLKIEKDHLCFASQLGKSSYQQTTVKILANLKAKADIGFFVGYTPNRKGYRIYNKRTRQIMETIHVTFDELTEQTTPIHSSSGPAPIILTPEPISSGLVPNSAHAIPYIPPTNNDLELLFQPMYDEYFETPTGDHQMPPIPAAPTSAILTVPSASISFDNDAHSSSHSPSY